MGSVSIGDCGIFFGDCGCLPTGKYCLDQVHQFYATHYWHGWRRFNYDSFPPLATEEPDSCVDTGYGLDLPLRYLKNQTAKDYSWSLSGQTVRFVITSAQTANRYTGTITPTSSTVVIQGVTSDVNGTLDYPYWDYGNQVTTYNIVSETEYTQTDVLPDILYPERSMTIVSTTSLSVPHSLSDFLSDCDALYSSVSLDDMETDYVAIGQKRSVVAVYNSVGSIGKTWATVTYPLGVYTGTIRAANTVRSEYDGWTGKDHVTWEGIKSLAEYVECTDSWDKEVVTFAMTDACTGEGTETKTAIPAGSLGDLLGIDADLYFRKRVDYKT